MHVYMCVFLYVYIYNITYIYIHMYVRTHARMLHACTYVSVCLYVCMYVCMYVRVCVYIYIRIFIYKNRFYCLSTYYYSLLSKGNWTELPTLPHAHPGWHMSGYSKVFWWCVDRTTWKQGKALPWRRPGVRQLQSAPRTREYLKTRDASPDRQACEHTQNALRTMLTSLQMPLRLQF